MSLYRREHVWWVCFYFDRARHRYSTEQTHKGKALAVASRIRNGFLAQRKAVEHPPGRSGGRRARPMVLGEAVDRYVETVMLTKRRRPDGTITGSVANELYRLERLVGYFGYNASLRQAAKWGTVAEFNHWLLRQMTPESANRLLSLLRAVLNKAYAWGELETPPYIRLNRTRPFKNRYLAPEEETRLIRACSPLLRDFVVFMLDTGARLNEALSLTWRDADLRRRPRAVVHFTKTKNGETRSVPLPKRVTAVLRRLGATAGGLDSLVFSEPARKTIYTKYGALFCRRGERIPISNYQLLWRPVRRATGLADVRMHDLRHTYAAKLVRAGVPLIEVAKLLGHRQIEMTMRYAYLAVEELDRAVAVLDREVRPACRSPSRRRRARKRHRRVTP